MIKIMLKNKHTQTTAAVIMACLLVTTMFIVPTTSTNHNPNAKTGFHTVTVDIVDDKVVMSIKPLLPKSGCGSDDGCEVDDGCPVENRTCCSGEASSFERVVLERGESYVVTLLSIENGENVFEATVTRTRLWKHAEVKGKLNLTLSLTETTMVSGGSSGGSRELAYIIEYADYTVRGVSIMSLSKGSKIYETCFSIMNYIPANKKEVISLEIVQFNATVTLSQHYAILSEVAKEMRKIYKHSQNQTFSELVDAYHAMEKEAKQISKTIEKQLPNYNHEILQSIAILTDPAGCNVACCMAEGLMSLEVEPLCGGGWLPPTPPSTCTVECWGNNFMTCYGTVSWATIACLFGCALASIGCGPFMPVCLAACFPICGTLDMVL
ncbi:hypothetical protein HM002_04255, partial [Candidatus Bathyarchaeota archaeon A05DMB-4]|nr:hypothetical protein [Candidatus Bathyarchaeota archaeon A05DMB-4]